MEQDIVTVVIAAARNGDVSKLLEVARVHGSSTVRIDQDPDELTALHWAAASGQSDAVTTLLSDAIAADVRALRSNNFSPLHAAAMNGHAHICEILLQSGADPNVQTQPQGYAPLHSAAWAGHRAAVEVLLKFGADTDVRNYRDETPAETAKRQGHEEVAALLGP